MDEIADKNVLFRQVCEVLYVKIVACLLTSELIV